MEISIGPLQEKSSMSSLIFVSKSEEFTKICIKDEVYKTLTLLQVQNHILHIFDNFKVTKSRGMTLHLPLAPCPFESFSVMLN